MIDQFRGGQGEGVALAERVALEELQMRLLAPLPLRDALKIVDVPADELGERGRPLLDARERRWILKHDLTVFRPADGRGTVREGSGFLVNDRLSAAQPDYRRVAGRSVRLLADFDVGAWRPQRRHDILVAYTSPPQLKNSP